MDSWHDTSVAILAGGLGTRLRSVIADRPKVMAPINGRPFLSYLFDQLHDAGIRRVLICTGYEADQVSGCFRNEYRTMELEYSREYVPLGTGGALRHALPHLNGKRILVLNGDSYVETDLRGFVEQHNQHMARISLVLTHMGDVQRFGLVTTNENGIVTGFSEKGKTTGPGWINGGVYVIEQEAVATIPSGREVSLERDVFPAQLGSGFYGFRLGRRFIDIGIPESYAEASGFFLELQKVGRGMT